MAQIVEPHIRQFSSLEKRFEVPLMNVPNGKRGSNIRREYKVIISPFWAEPQSCPILIALVINQLLDKVTRERYDAPAFVCLDLFKHPAPPLRFLKIVRCTVTVA